MMQIADFIDALQPTLEWKESDLSAAITAAYHEGLCERLDETMSALSTFDADAAAAARLTFATMDAETRLQFISAPHIAAIIMDPRTLSHRGWRGLLLSKLGMFAGHVKLAPEAGDHRGQTSAAAQGKPGLGTRGGQFTFAISYGGDLPIPPMDRGGNAVVPVPERALANNYQKLSAAEDLLKTVSASACRFVAANTEVLAFRSETELPNQFSSGSFRMLPGFSLLLNSHLPKCTAWELADGILHEAIHAIIYRYEAFNGRLLRIGSRPDKSVISPWSGAPLNIDSFAQACFVWYGLFHFWQNSPATRAIRLRDRAASGFREKSYVEIWRGLGGFFKPEISEVMGALHKHV